MQQMRNSTTFVSSVMHEPKMWKSELLWLQPTPLNRMPWNVYCLMLLFCKRITISKLFYYIMHLEYQSYVVFALLCLIA
jgi:hypothetical protein